ncbi:MAG: hypothetical protein IJG40_16255 [Oscillospiraceae bacterium]|nr:hypothetical protein [Oscillospiraceae bacterium]MBQ4453622.1 hypothetical protein [Clostridia bacterium]
MKNKNILLLRTLLLSTSGRNIYRYSKDKKKRKKIVGNAIGVVLLYAMLMAYCIATCIGYGMIGLIDAAPEMCALMISALAFVFTFFKTNGYLFNFREYDMLMSLPFEARTIAGCKFLYMYIKSLPWYLSISVAMMAGYGYYARPAFFVYPVWILLSFFLPIIPMLISAFFGFLIAKVSAGFRKTNIIQTILTFVFLIFCFSLRFILTDLFKNDKVEATLEKTSEITGNAAKTYLPAGWFADAVKDHSILGGLLLIGVSALLFAAVFTIVGNSYRNINSALKSHAAAKNYRMTGQKQRSVVTAIAYKEFKRLTGSTAYMTNAAIGELLALLLGIVTLLIGFDRIIAVITQGAPIDATMLQPAIPFIIYFLIGMVATTACSPSLEGKNYWIVQSLPIEKKTLYQGKMLFNMVLTVPFMAFSTLCLCISAKVPVLNTVLYLVLGFALCAFSTAWGCVCGIRHMRLDWENEIEVIKQGAAVAIYMLPNMFVVMGLMVLVVFLGTKMDHKLLTIVLTLITALLAGLSYRRVMVLAKRG